MQTGCDARRDERRVAGHTNEEQRSSAPVCAAKMGYLFTEITLIQDLFTMPDRIRCVWTEHSTDAQQDERLWFRIQASPAVLSENAA